MSQRYLNLYSSQNWAHDLSPLIWSFFFYYLPALSQFQNQKPRGHLCDLYLTPHPSPIHHVILSILPKYPSCQSTKLHLHYQPHHSLLRAWINLPASLPVPVKTVNPHNPQNDIDKTDKDKFLHVIYSPGGLYPSDLFTWPTSTPSPCLPHPGLMQCFCYRDYTFAVSLLQILLSTLQLDHTTS